MGPYRSDEAANKGKPSIGDIEEDGADEPEEMDGWRIGFEVQMQGVGRVMAMGGDDHHDDEDGSSSDFESDEDDRVGGDNGPYSGYTTIPHEPSAEPERSDGICCQDGQPVNADTATVAGNDGPYSKYLLPKPEFVNQPIKHQPVEIQLDEGKINEIKSIMSKINLKPPPWFNSEEISTNINDSKLLEFVHKLKDDNK